MKNYPSELLVDNNIQTELSMAKGVKSIRRYVDDTLAQIAGTLEEVQNGIMAVGCMYQENFTISMNLNV